MKTAIRLLFRKSLLLQKGEILNKSNEFREVQSASRFSFADEHEQATAELVNSVSIHLHERERNQLMAIEKALSKIENGTFGECEGCGNSITEARLKARPFAALCIECMEEREESGPLPN